MILKSMTSFILGIEDYVRESHNKERGLDLIVNYAKFIKQLLERGMFIPCSEGGFPLPEPQMRPERNSFDEEDMDYDAQELYEYIQAKKKVLFKEFRIVEDGIIELSESGNYIEFAQKEIIFTNEFGHSTQIYRIEDLVELGIELTEEAEKLIKNEE